MLAIHPIDPPLFVIAPAIKPIIAPTINVHNQPMFFSFFLFDIYYTVYVTLLFLIRQKICLQLQKTIEKPCYIKGFDNHITI